MNKLDIIFLKDPHLLLGFPKPLNRKDNFEEVIQKKWDYILNYCNKHQITNIVITGDLFDKMKLSQWSLMSFFKNKKFLFNIKEKLGKPLISIRGNHDEFNGKNTNEDTAFGLMIELGLIDYIGDEKENNFKEYLIDNKKLHIYGFDYKLNDTLLFKKIKQTKFTGDYNISVLHTSVVDVKTNKEKFECIGYDTLLKIKPETNMWILGHFHKGFPTKYYKDKYFVNPWNLTRLARDEYVLNDEHKPEFVHSTFKVVNDKIIVSKIKNIKIPVLKFDKSFIEDAKTVSEQIINEFDFFTKLDEKVEENFDEYVFLENLKKEKKINSEVYEIIKNIFK
jgi:DNA repair exonuclease SbcCD nuclease subunit